MEGDYGAKSIPWQAVEGFGDGTIYARKVGTRHHQKEDGQKWYWQLPEKRRTKEYKVIGSNCSPTKEVLEQVKRHTDMDCDAYMMRRAYHAGGPGNWEGSKEESRRRGKISE